MEYENTFKYFTIILLAVILMTVLATQVGIIATGDDLQSENTGSGTQTILTDNSTASTLAVSVSGATVETFSATSKNNSWLEFDGVNDYVYISDDVIPLMQPDQNYSFFTWIKTEQTGIQNIFGGATTQAINRTQLYTSSNGRLTLKVGGTKRDIVIYINKNKWFFVGYVSGYNGSDMVSTTYLDSVPIVTRIVINNISNNFDDEVRIGKRTTVEFLNGSVDGPRFFNYSLNQSEINYLYEESLFYPNNSIFVPIAYGHGIGGEGYDSVNIIVFNETMNYTNTKGYTPITITQLKNLSLNQISIDKPIVFIFDDGYKDIYQNGSSILNEYGFNVSLAIVTERTSNATNNSAYLYAGLYPVMNWSDVKNMSLSGHEILSHSVNHSHMLNLNLSQRIYQFNQSRWAIYNNISIMPTTFIFPYNEWNSTLINECLNYYEICSGDDGNGYFILNNESFSNGEFNRFNLFKSTLTLNQFKNYINAKNYSSYEPNNYWMNLKLDEASSTTAHDTSGNSNDGTITGATWGDDGIDITLTEDTDYTLVGAIFTVINDNFAWRGIEIDYSYWELVRGSGYSSVNYLTLQMGEDGLAGWVPAVVALSIGMIFIGMLLIKSRRKL